MVEAAAEGVAGATSQGSEEMQIEALKRSRAKGNVAKRISFRSDPRRRGQRPSCDFVPLTKQEDIGRKTWATKRKCART